MKDRFIRTRNLKWKEINKDVFEKICLVGGKDLNFSLLKISPNKEISYHKHFDTRYNFVLKGSMSDGNETYQKGDLIVNKKGTGHFLKAGPRGCEFILIWT